MEKIRRYGRETNFTDIMYIKFTSDFKTYLDKIADGKANSYNIFKNRENEKIKGKKIWRCYKKREKLIKR